MLEFELLQIAVGNRTELSHTPSVEEWSCLYRFAAKQAMVGVLFNGIEKLNIQCLHPPKAILMNWIGQTLFIKKQNDLLNKRAGEITMKLASDAVGTHVSSCAL